MNKSESIKNLVSALNKAQQEFDPVIFDSVNPFYKSKYASLTAVFDATREALLNNGLTITQPAVSDENGVGVTTLLFHSSGEYIESTVTVPIGESANPAQEAGKDITYLRRYSLASMLGLTAEEDTDGNKGTQSSTKPTKTAKVEDSKQENWTSEQIAMLVELYPDKHVKNIVSTMNLSEKLTNETSQKDLKKWFEVYATERKAHEPQESALRADNKLFG